MLTDASVTSSQVSHVENVKTRKKALERLNVKKGMKNDMYVLLFFGMMLLHLKEMFQANDVIMSLCSKTLTTQRVAVMKHNMSSLKDLLYNSTNISCK